MKTVSLSGLPHHTKVETIVGLVNKVVLGKLGGFSINADLHQPTDGYMVGGYGFQQQLNTTRETVEELLPHATGSHYIGCWIHMGNVYLELSTYHEDRDDAMAIGRKRDELAIYDVKNNQDIGIKY